MISLGFRFLCNFFLHLFIYPLYLERVKWIDIITYQTVFNIIFKLNQPQINYKYEIKYMWTWFQIWVPIGIVSTLQRSDISLWILLQICIICYSFLCIHLHKNHKMRLNIKQKRLILLTTMSACFFIIFLFFVMNLTRNYYFLFSVHTEKL